MNILNLNLGSEHVDIAVEVVISYWIEVVANMPAYYCFAGAVVYSCWHCHNFDSHTDWVL